MPASLTGLQAVESADVVLPAWYTLPGEVSSAQPWETSTVMWYLVQEGKDPDQVREESLSARGQLLRPVRAVGKSCLPWGEGLARE